MQTLRHSICNIHTQKYVHSQVTVSFFNFSYSYTGVFFKFHSQLRYLFSMLLPLTESFDFTPSNIIFFDFIPCFQAGWKDYETKFITVEMTNEMTAGDHMVYQKVWFIRIWISPSAIIEHTGKQLTLGLQKCYKLLTLISKQSDAHVQNTSLLLLQNTIQYTNIKLHDITMHINSMQLYMCKS